MPLVSRLVPLSACTRARASTIITLAVTVAIAIAPAATAGAPVNYLPAGSQDLSPPGGGSIAVKKPTNADGRSAVSAQRRPLNALETELIQLSFPGWTGSPLNTCFADHAAPVPDLERMDAAKTAILYEFGLHMIAQKSFQRGQRYIHVDLFEFANSDGAYAAYCFLRRGAITVIKRGDSASEDDDSISFVQGKTFISIYGTSSDDDESKDVIRLIASAVAKVIPEHGSLPAVLNSLPQLELLHGSEKVVMGPLSARRFFPAPYLASLDYKNCKVACVADYQIQMPAKERVKMLIFDYGLNSQAAQASYQSYLTELCQSKEEDPSELFGRPSNQFKNGATYTNIALKGPRVALVSGARKRFSADLLLRQLR